MTDGAGIWVLAGTGMTAVAAVVTAVARRPTKQGANADYADRLVGASVGLVEQLQEEIAGWRTEAHDCETKLAAMQDELTVLHRRYDRLEQYLAAVGLDAADQGDTQ